MCRSGPNSTRWARGCRCRAARRLALGCAWRAGRKAEVEPDALCLQEHRARALAVGLQDVAAVDEVGHRQHPFVILVGAAIVGQPHRAGAEAEFPQRLLLGVGEQRLGGEGEGQATVPEKPDAAQRCPVRPGSGRATACGQPTPGRSGGPRRAGRSAWLTRGALPRDRTGVPDSPGGRRTGATAAVIGRQWTTRGLCRGREEPRRGAGQPRDRRGPAAIRGLTPLLAALASAHATENLQRSTGDHRAETTWNRDASRGRANQVSIARSVARPVRPSYPSPARMWLNGFSDGAS